MVPGVAQPPDALAGVGIAEDIDLITTGIANNSWVEGTLGGVGAALDSLAMITDPVGVLLQYGVAWLIEHVQPLTEALDALAGDPGQIAAVAETWRNTSVSRHSEAAHLQHLVRSDLAEWTGSAAEAYRATAQTQHDVLTGIAKASATLAALIEGAGMLVAGVRLLVRDAIATVVSRLIVYAAEATASLGVLTPLVVRQVSALVSAWAARIARWLRDLIASLRNLFPSMRRLGELIDDLMRMLRRPSRPSRPSRKEPPDPEVEKQRIHDLGVDPAVGRFRPTEAETAVRIETELDVTLTRAPPGSTADWVDESGKTYDAVGNFPQQYFERQWPQLRYQIERHLTKADLVPVDVSQFTPQQVAMIEQFIADRGLAPRVFMVGQ